VYIASSKKGDLLMKTSAQVAGFILRSDDIEKTAAFYRTLGLGANKHKHGGPIHFELGPTSPSCVAEIYKYTEKFPHDAIMVQVESLDLVLFTLGEVPEVRRDVGDMRLAYIKDPDGRAVMIYEVIETESAVTGGLAGERCLPCGGDIPALDIATIEKYLSKIDGWKLFDGHLEKTFVRKDFPDAMLFGAAIVPIAETEQHHPDFSIHDYKYVEIRLITKAINALSINDFILAAKIDALVK